MSKQRTMPKVGERLWIKAIGNEARRRKSQFVEEVEVVKVGRKYFRCKPIRSKHSREIQFWIDRGMFRQHCGFYCDWALYATLQEIEDEDEGIRLLVRVRESVGIYSTKRPSLAALRSMCAALDADVVP